jgi:hypothetical protein
MQHERKRFAKPTVYTRNWYQTGAKEMGLKASDADTYSRGRLQCAILLNLGNKQYYDVFRALKGKILRAEVDGHDQSDFASIPYTITESSYDVVLDDTKSNEVPVFRVHTRETFTTHHKRRKDDARMKHELLWETNAYGDITKVVRAQYGKPKSDLFTAEARAA